MRLPYKTIKVPWFLLDLRVRSIIKTAAEKLSLNMTYASHARVITEIIQANLIHLSIKMTMPYQSGAPFVDERVFQNRGVCGQAFPSFPSPTPFLPPFCSRPIFRASRMRKTNTRCPYFVRFVRERLLRRLLKKGRAVPLWSGGLNGFRCELSRFSLPHALLIQFVFNHFGSRLVYC